jgi:hypothetical protein
MNNWELARFSQNIESWDKIPVKKITINNQAACSKSRIKSSY